MKDVWYECDRCTACCKWPGDVKVEDDEVADIAKYLGLDLQVFIDTHTRLRTNRSGLSLLEKENHECSWLEDDKCMINDVKPRQCREFPNKWNFEGWQKVCQAKPYPMGQAIRLGLVKDV